MSETVQVKFERKRTGSCVWVEMRKQKNPWNNKNYPLLCYHFDNMVDGVGPGRDWVPTDYEE